jgi:hypothetical protein
MPEPAMLAVSARTGEGIAEWTGWLEREKARRHASGVAAHHAHAHEHSHVHDGA